MRSHSRSVVVLVLVLVLAFALALVSTMARAQTLVYFGTYTGPKSEGIYVSRLDTATGRLSEPLLAAETVSPSFLSVHPTRQYLYAVNEVDDFEGERAGSASAFAIDGASGRLTPLNRTSTKGPGPCYLSCDRSGRYLFVANYVGGSVAVLPIAADGRLGPASAFVQHDSSGPAPHAHSIDLDASNRFALAADLGLDRVFVYRFDSLHGALEPNDPPFLALEPGSGPRHVALHPGGRYAFVLSEIEMTLTVLDYNPASGALAVKQTVSSLPDGVAIASGYDGAEVLVHPSGRFLYASNRGHDTLAVFAIDESEGTLRLLEHVPTGGKTPRGFGIDPSGSYLLAANQSSDTVVVFRIDGATGRLTPTGAMVAVGSPVAVAFVVSEDPGRKLLR
jgi:6-phosphogluconolactonase